MQVPLIPIQKDMNVAELAAARQVAQPRPSWCSIFTKAYAQVVAARPELRRACLTFPWVRMFEDPATSVDIAVDTFLDDENVLIFVPIKQPETCPLLDIDRIIAWSKERPIERLPRYRRARRLARMPRFVREWVWWSLLNVSGHQRSRHFGTFGVSSMAKWGVDSLRPISPCVTVLHGGTIDAQGPRGGAFDVRSSRHGWFAAVASSRRNGTKSQDGCPRRTEIASSFLQSHDGHRRSRLNEPWVPRGAGRLACTVKTFVQARRLYHGWCTS